MGASRIRNWSPVALLLGVILVIGGLAAPAEAAIARSLSLQASASVTGTGSQVTFSGTLTKSPVGSPLKLQIKAGSIWLDSRLLTTTTAAGAYRAVVVMPNQLGTYYFRAVASSGGGRASATSRTVGITVLHRVSASLKANRTTVTAGQLVSFTGHVSPCLVGQHVALQQYVNGGWSNLAIGALSSRCNVVRSVKPTRTTSYRLYVPRHGSYAPAFSAKVRITFSGPAPTAPKITTASLPAGSTGTAYSQTLTKTGNAGSWSKTSGSLPNGLLLSSSTGVISGTPTAGGIFNFTVRFTESASGLTASKALSITIAAGPVITTTSLPDGKRGDAYSFTLTKTGADGTWSALHLPSGITLDQNTGAISGTPIVEGDFVVAATFTETASGKVANKSLPLHIATSPPPVIDTTTLPDGVKNAPYSTTLASTGNAGTWSITQGALPPGVTLNAATGALSGTPTAADDYLFTVTFTETAAQTKDTQGLVLHVSPAANSPAISTATLPNGTVGAAYTAQLDGAGTGTWTITKLSLPPGLVLSTNPLTPGKISGTPTTAGDYIFQVKYTTLTGSNTKILSIHVDPAP
jgi:hypothetical protein